MGRNWTSTSNNRGNVLRTSHQKGVVSNATIKPQSNIHYVEVNLEGSDITLTGDSSNSLMADEIRVTIKNTGATAELTFAGDFESISTTIDSGEIDAISFFCNGEKFALNGSIDSGVATSLNHGFVDYNDSSTVSSPVSIIANTWIDIPNDKQGPFSNEGYAPNGVNSLMDGGTGYLDFSDLTLGSDILIRIDFTVTPNTNNSLLETRYVLGQGAGEYSLPVRSRRLDSGSGIPYSSEKGSFYIYMGDTNTLGGVGKLQMRLSTAGTMVNNGVAIKIYKK